MSVAEQPPAETADPAKGKAVVLYDGQCPLCRRAVRLLKRLDWLGRLHYHDCRDTDHWPPSAEPLSLKALLAEMHVVTPDRKHAPSGFRAIRWMAWRIPLLLPLAPLMYLPGARWLGTRLYLWIARNRYNLVPCDDGGCRVKLPGTKEETKS